MLTGYGHAKIHFKDQVFNLVPSFANMAKLGTPKEIIEMFGFLLDDSPWYVKFDVSLTVLEACAGEALPVELTGKVEVSGWTKAISYFGPKNNLNMLTDVIVLATHCLKHGICGDVETEGGGNSEKLEEFDAYSYIEMALEHLNASREEAATMTMTEFVRRMRAKYPDNKEKENGKMSQQEVDDLYSWGEVH